ncbi:energy transducer TonB [Leptospira sp. 96542]|nr:energy transducer TonB [Leptospira sp. 96542]
MKFRMDLAAINPKALVLTLTIHLFILGLVYLHSIPSKEAEAHTHFQLQMGAVEITNPKESAEGLGKSQNSQSNQISEVGTKTTEQEILEFQNKLSYPALALEQNLEDICQYRVSVDENGSLGKLDVITPCRYSVFDKQVREQLSRWKFVQTKGKNFILPIRFRLDARD